MYIKAAFFTLMLALGVIVPSFGSGVGNFQDSVKRVTIKVIASEKPKMMSSDSLMKNSAPAVVKSTSRSANVKKAGSVTGKALSINTTRRGSANAPLVERKSPQLQTARPAVATKPTPKTSGTKAASSVSNTSPKVRIKGTPPPLNPPTDEQHTHEEVTATELADDNAEVAPTNIKTSRAYLWVGFMLVVVGAILAVLFGKTALLVSIAGMVFVIIGYSITQR